MKIALALSGGGFRASIFHLGVLTRLAKENKLEEISLLSTVSGGSLCAGLVISLNNLHWPSSEEFLGNILPKAHELLTTVDLQKTLIHRTISRFWSIYQTRADDVSLLIQKHWGIKGNLSQLPEFPRWMINATCYESGKNWRFEQFRMGDYVFGYSSDTNTIPIADAMAASSGLPAAIGSLKIDASRYNWFKYTEKESENTLGSFSASKDIQLWKTSKIDPLFPEAHLWDGGVYDNHGLEGIHDFQDGWHKHIDFLIVSDAAGRAKPEKYHGDIKGLGRMATGIMMNQVRSLRSRAIMERLRNHPEDKGVFLQTGNSSRTVLKNANESIHQGCLTEEQAEKVAEYPTVIKKISEEDYSLIFRHGFEVTDYTLYAYFSDQFKYLGFNSK
jgi:NTE family protein